MKKLYVLFILLSLFICGNVSAEVTDTTPPELRGYTIPSVIINDKTFNVEVDANDDVSQVDLVSFIFKVKGQNYSIVKRVMINVSDGKYNYYKLSDEPGEYELFYVTINDTAGNETCYVAEGQNAGDYCKSGKTIKGITITVKENENRTYATLESMSISKTSISPGEEITIKIKGSSNTTGVYMEYEEPIGQIIGFKEENGYFVATTNKFQGAGTVKIQSIVLYNEDGVMTIYAPNKESYDSSSNGDRLVLDSFDLSKYSITVSGEADKEKPRLGSIKVSSNVVYAPGVVKFTLDAYDNVGIKYIYFHIVPNFKSTISGYSNVECKGKNHEYICTWDVDQYMQTGEYYLEGVYLVDQSGNTANYISDHDKAIEYSYDEIEKLIIKVDTKEKSDLVSSTSNKDVLSQIEKTADDAKITLDTTKNNTASKEIFDLIKGTNRTLYLESKGIQWIFEGKDIVNETKDIYTNITITKKEENEESDKAIDSVNSLLINFVSNGKLPGKAKVRIKADYAFRNFIGETNLFVYYYDEEKEMFDVVAQKINMTSDGYYEFYIEHNSKYIISNTVPNKKYLSSNKSTLKLNGSTTIIKETPKTTNKVTTQSTTSKNTTTTQDKTTANEQETTTNVEDNTSNISTSNLIIDLTDKDTLNVDKKEKKKNITLYIIIGVCSLIIIVAIIFLIIKRKDLLELLEKMNIKKD